MALSSIELPSDDASLYHWIFVLMVAYLATSYVNFAKIAHPTRFTGDSGARHLQKAT